jgi:hypothetical protein
MRWAGLPEAGAAPSMGIVSDACNNAMCESFVATPECKLLDCCCSRPKLRR